MKIRTIITMLAVFCLLVVSISPLTARNTPYPEKPKDGNTAHPWQDDDQYADPDVPIEINIPVGPIVIRFAVPMKWFTNSVSLTKSQSTTVPVSTQKTSKPMSLNQKGASQ